MELGMIGLGRMGANMTRRLMRAGHSCVVYDVWAASVQALAGEGATGAASLADFVARLHAPRATVIDGGNSYYHDDLRRAAERKARDLHYVDVGTSGGIWGLDRGFCLMIGGEAAVIEQLDPIFAALAPGVDAAPRLAGREALDGTAEQGYLHCGPNGAGHFVKMVHNGIEYGLMAAYAEGLGILRDA